MRKRHLRPAGFKPNFIPGFCPYKFFYVWMNFALPFVAVPICAAWLLVGYALGRRQETLARRQAESEPAAVAVPAVS
jgi:hypothetical protein